MRAIWLKTRLSVAEAEKANLVEDRRLGPLPVPFGFCNDRWQALLFQMCAGDEIWEFSSTSENWENLAGCAGIALVRNGEVISHFTTVEN